MTETATKALLIALSRNDVHLPPHVKDWAVLLFISYLHAHGASPSANSISVLPIYINLTLEVPQFVSKRADSELIVNLWQPTLSKVPVSHSQLPAALHADDL